MSKSFDFCKEAASNPERSSLCDRDWKDAIEIDSLPIFDSILNGCREFYIDGYDIDGNIVRININLSISTDADFTYFTSSASIHDGTLFFVNELFEDCACKILSCQTYDKNKSAPKNGDTIHYTVGNFVVLMEHDADGALFAPQDKKWMSERTTVLLPVFYENNRDCQSL